MSAGNEAAVLRRVECCVCMVGVGGWKQGMLGHVILIIQQDFDQSCPCGNWIGFPERLLCVRPSKSCAENWHNIAYVTFSYSRQVTMPSQILGMENRDCNT